MYFCSNTSTNYQCETGRNEYADCKNGKFLEKLMKERNDFYI